MKKNILLTLAVLLISAVFFVGCGKKSYFESTKDLAPKEDEIIAEEMPSAEESQTDDSQDNTDQKPNDTPQEVIVKVYVYNDTDAVVTETVTGAEMTDKTGLVDINSATKDELMTLTGIGGTRADAIISYRDEKGSFAGIEDIKNVSGIGDGTYEKIKDKITV